MSANREILPEIVAAIAAIALAFRALFRYLRSAMKIRRNTRKDREDNHSPG